MDSRGASGALYQQSAIAGVISCLGSFGYKAASGKWRWRLGLTQQELANRVRSGMEQH